MPRSDRYLIGDVRAGAGGGLDHKNARGHTEEEFDQLLAQTAKITAAVRRSRSAPTRTQQAPAPVPVAQQGQTSADEALYAMVWGPAPEPGPVTDQAYLNAWGARPEPAPITDQAYLNAFGPHPELKPVTDPAYLAAWGTTASSAETDDAYLAAWGAPTNDQED